MAKEPRDREDLLRDGLAMVHRGQISLDGCEVFVGFRADGQASLYWDQDPVFQFNAAGELRRVYIAGMKLLVQDQQLLILKRDASEFAAQQLSAKTVLDRLQHCLVRLANLAGESQQAWQTVGQEPEAFAQRVLSWATELSQSEIRLAAMPHANADKPHDNTLSDPIRREPAHWVRRTNGDEQDRPRE
ncbi:MAG: hypothetical protein AAGD07_03605 [Planctomycetota bacterium]